MRIIAHVVIVLALAGSYPLIAQQMNVSDGGANDSFGYSVSVSVNTGLISAPFDDDIGTNSGSAYVFRELGKAAGTFTETAKLLASDGASSDSFGSSVSLSSSIGLIGSIADDDNGQSSGSAYVFRNLDLATGTVYESAKLLASDGAANDQFGIALSLSENSGLIGSIRDDDNGIDSGSAYLFRGLDSVTGTINESVKLIASDGAAGDRFGSAVSLDGSTGLIGAIGDDEKKENNIGSAYVFRGLDTATGTINESAKLIPSDGTAIDQFGTSVSLSGSTGLIGAQFDGENGNGSAYIFRGLDTATGTVNESAKLLASDAAANGFFGFSVCLKGSTGLIGAIGDGDNGVLAGSVYVFRGLDKAIGTVNESVKLLASNGLVDALFGYSVSLDGDRFVIGSRNGDGIVPESGRAFTGTISSVTTLDSGDTSAFIDGISFKSRTDWIVGASTSKNCKELTDDDSAEVLEIGTKISVGANSGANCNNLKISGSVVAHELQIGANGNFGNVVHLSKNGSSSIDNILLFADNTLQMEGEFTSFVSINSRLNGAQLFVVVDGRPELVTARNFNEVLSVTFESQSGITILSPEFVWLGDVNLDGLVNLLDVEPFVGLLIEGQFQIEADINMDRVVNLLDVVPFVELLTGG